MAQTRRAFLQTAAMAVGAAGAAAAGSTGNTVVPSVDDGAPGTSGQAGGQGAQPAKPPTPASEIQAPKMRFGTAEISRLTQSRAKALQITRPPTCDGQQVLDPRPAGLQQLEYPIGRVLFRTNGYISAPRISPDQKQVAFLEHPLFGDNRGYVAVADAEGTVKRVTGESGAVEGLAWSRDGREIWFSSAERRRLPP